MKKLVSMLLVVMMILSCGLASVTLAEKASSGSGVEEMASPKEQELATVLAWLMQDISDANATEVLGWTKESILAKLEGYDKPLEYNTKEEIADQIVAILSVFQSFSAMADSAAESGILDLENMGGLFTLFGSMMGGGEGMTVEWNEEGDSQSVEIDMSFNGTYWENGNLKLEAVFQDGYYKVAITGGETELSYLCEYEELVDEAQGAQFSALRGIGTGDAEQDKTQPDKGQATFIYDWRTDEIIWRKPDGTETVFTHIVDPLDETEWFAGRRALTIHWLGDKNYDIHIEESTENGFATWDYQCTLDETAEIMKGAGTKTAFGDAGEDYSGAGATFVFQNTRRNLVWTDDHEESAKEGMTFTAVPLDVVHASWTAEPYIVFIMAVDGYYDIHVMKEGEDHAYFCSWDWDTSTFTALDPATLDANAYSFPLEIEKYTSTGTFVLKDDTHLVWHDDAGLAGEGMTLERF